jgi:hypothetical protein
MVYRFIEIKNPAARLVLLLLWVRGRPENQPPLEPVGVAYFIFGNRQV